MNRLMTPRLEEAFKGFPLYSQDGKGKDAVCVAIFAIGNARWFVLEGSREGDDTIMFCIVVGLAEDEYGYVSLNELAEIEIDCRSKGYGILQVTEVPYFKPRPLREIPDSRLQSLLSRLHDRPDE